MHRKITKRSIGKSVGLLASLQQLVANVSAQIPPTSTIGQAPSSGTITQTQQVVPAKPPILDYITAIGQLWPLFLVFTVAIILFSCRRRLGTFLDNIVNKSRDAEDVSLKGGTFELSLKSAAKEAVEEVLEESKEQSAFDEQQVAQPITSSNEEPKNERAEPQTADIMAYFDAINEQNEEEVDRLYQNIQQSELNASKKLDNEAFYYYARFRLGDSTAVKKLQNLVEKDASSVSPFVWLAHIYESVNDYGKAAQFWSKVIDCSKEDHDRAGYTVNLSKCLNRLGRQEEAIDRIVSEIQKCSDQQGLFDLYRGLANLYQEDDDIEMKALALEKALEYNPNNTQVLFDVAFSLSQVKLGLLSLSTYLDLLNFDTDNSMAMNNLGVRYAEFDLTINAVRLFQKASEKKNTLASANLAYRLIEAGFAKEATEILEYAKQLDDVHPNVGSALVSLSKKNESENKKKDKILKLALQQQQFFREYMEKYLIPMNGKAFFEGGWSTADGIVISVTQIERALEATWVEKGKVRRLKGTTFNNAAKVTTYKVSSWASSPPKETDFEKDREGYMYLSEDELKISLLTLEEDTSTLYILSRSTIEEDGLDT